MKISFSTPFADALAMWRRDRALLLPLVGLAMFLPQYAQVLLLPEMPRPPAQATEEAARVWNEALTTWVSAYGGWYLVGPAMSLFGALALIALYVDRSGPTLSGALGRALVLFPRYVLASILVSLPMALMMALALMSPVLLIFVLPPILYISARTMLVAPALIAQSPIGAVAAIGRSWRLTAGNGWTLAGIYAAPFLAAQFVGGALLSMDAALGGNPVARAITSGLAGVVIAGAALTIALVEVAIYRRLARNGT